VVAAVPDLLGFVVFEHLLPVVVEQIAARAQQLLNPEIKL